MNIQALMNSFGYRKLHDVVNKTEGHSLKLAKSINIQGTVISTIAKYGQYADISSILRNRGIFRNANEFFAIRMEHAQALGMNRVQSIVRERLGFPTDVLTNVVLGGYNERRFLLFLY